jgi:hypothetical protein
MKKILIALAASIALVLGTGAFVSGANAAVYPGTVVTSSSIVSTSSTTEGKYFNVRVRVSAGNAAVSSGSVKVIFGGRAYSTDVDNGAISIKVKAPSVSKTRLKTLKAYYTPKAGSVFTKSSASKTITVKNKKKR